MTETKISQLAISSSLNGTEYLIVDNTEVTRRTTINSLSSVLTLTNNQEFNELKNTIKTLSSFSSGYLQIKDITSDYTLLSTDTGITITHSNTQNITAYITNKINTVGFNTSIAQLDTGTITIALSSNYANAKLISYNNNVMRL